MQQRWEVLATLSYPPSRMESQPFGRRKYDCEYIALSFGLTCSVTFFPKRYPNVSLGCPQTASKSGMAIEITPEGVYAERYDRDVSEQKGYQVYSITG